MTVPTRSVANGAGYYSNKKSDLQNCQIQKRQSVKKDYLIPKLKVNDENNTGDPDGYTSHFPSESVNNSFNSGSSSEVDDSNNTETHMLLQQKQLCSTTSNNSQTVNSNDDMSVNFVKKVDSINIINTQKVNGNVLNVNSLKQEKIECNGCCDVDSNNCSETDCKSQSEKLSRCVSCKNQLKTKTNMLLNINR